MCDLHPGAVHAVDIRCRCLPNMPFMLLHTHSFQLDDSIYTIGSLPRRHSRVACNDIGYSCRQPYQQAGDSSSKLGSTHSYTGKSICQHKCRFLQVLHRDTDKRSHGNGRYSGLFHAMRLPSTDSTSGLLCLQTTELTAAGLPGLFTLFLFNITRRKLRRAIFYGIRTNAVQN